MDQVRFALALMLAATPAAIVAEQFDPRMHRAFSGPPSEVMVLGSAHLTGLPKAFTPDQLAPLLDRLAAWKPDIISVEALSGGQCDELRRYAALHDKAADGYCWDPAPAAKATGLDVTAATLAVERLLADWPAAPTAAARRHLAALMLAGDDRPSALVQWLRLPAAERHAGDGLDSALVDALELARTGRNETYVIGSALAARLGLERLANTDDHTADGPFGDDPAYGPTIQKLWDNPQTSQRQAADTALAARLGRPGAVLDMYRAYNDANAPALAFASDFGAALADPTSPYYGRRYVAWWETRNLRMVANIRGTLIAHPGARVLAIVGASHKGYFESYLGMMHDVRLADTAKLLR